MIGHNHTTGHEVHCLEYSMSKQKAPFFHLPTPAGAESWTPEEDKTSVDKKINAPFNRVCVMASFVCAWPAVVCPGAGHLGFAVIEVACLYSSGKFLEFRGGLKQARHVARLDRSPILPSGRIITTTLSNNLVPYSASVRDASPGGLEEEATLHFTLNRPNNEF